MNLYACYIGGTHEKALIELHDMRFVVANQLEDTFEPLRQSWWGTPKSLHIDAWGILHSVDGYDVHIRNTPPPADHPKLYFVNLGGYTETEFTELHQNVFVVAESPVKARVKALKPIQHWESPHKDYEYEVEDIVCVDTATLKDSTQYAHLTPTSTPTPFAFSAKRIPIGKKES
ncbi:MAG: DUF1543 domain-containing protein [Holosporaceae bacterium]|nr:MAG: DUF1543 domain-containing protein [Holosporaceae bacterium]